MMRGLTLFLLPIAAFGLSGCLAKTAFDVATAPVRVASKAQAIFCRRRHQPRRPPLQGRQGPLFLLGFVTMSISTIVLSKYIKNTE